MGRDRRPAGGRPAHPLPAGQGDAHGPAPAADGRGPGLPMVGGLDFVRMLLTPVADPGLWPFAGDGARLLLAGNAGHSDIPVDAPGSGLMGLLMTMLGQTVGFPVPEGGAARLAEALASRLQACGGEIRCGTPADRIVVE